MQVPSRNNFYEKLVKIIKNISLLLCTFIYCTLVDCGKFMIVEWIIIILFVSALYITMVAIDEAYFRSLSQIRIYYV